MDADRIYLISDASRLVQVESHVLRYWEDELKLPVKRNELGHRYYTAEDIREFTEIKQLKEKGLQLKAIRLILKDGKLEPLGDHDFREKIIDRDPVSTTEKLVKRESFAPAEKTEQSDDKSMRLQLLLKRLISEVVEESNEKLYDEISGALTKELDYQFRMQEEREEQRENRQMLLEEEHYKQLDALLRGYKGKKKPEKNKPVRTRRSSIFQKIK